jgi:hypothetical protein
MAFKSGMPEVEEMRCSNRMAMAWGETSELLLQTWGECEDKEYEGQHSSIFFFHLDERSSVQFF